MATFMRMMNPNRMTGTQAMTIFGIHLFLSLLSRLETVAKFIFCMYLKCVTQAIPSKAATKVD